MSTVIENDGTPAAAPTATLTVSEAIAEVVIRRSPNIFGLMGNGNAHFVSALTRRAAPFAAVRHEVATVIAAQAAHLATGATATATTTYGAGFTNMLTSLAEARIARTPVVVVVGDAPSTGRRHQDIDQIGAAAAVGVVTVTASAADAVSLAEQAYDLAARHRVPVIVAIPYDLVDAPITEQVEVEPIDEERILPVAQRAASEPIPNAQEIVAALVGAERPLILAGRGAVQSGAGEGIRELGDRVGALFATSLLAHRITGSPWDIGLAGGFSSAEAAAVIAQADVVLVIGASLNLYQMRYNHLLDGAHRVIQVDVLPEATHAQVTDYVRSDASAFVAALLEHAPAPGRADGWRTRIGSLADLLTGPEFPEFGPDGRLDPRALVIALDALLPLERTITQDTGHFMGWAARHLDAPDPYGTQLPGLALQSIGLGLGAGLGIAHARPDRLPVVVSGDGGAAMALAELDTLIRTVPSALVLVLNDAAYGMEVHQYGVRGLDTAAMVFDEQDFASIARALGGRGVNIRRLDDLVHVKDWLDEGAKGVLVVDAAISQEVVADWLHASNAYYASIARA